MSARLLLIAAAVFLSGVPAQAAGKKYALLVGVKDYDHADFATLKYTENDAEELAVVLKDAGYAEVVILTSTRGKKDRTLAPTAANIRAQLKKLSDKVTKDDLLLVGFAGHGQGEKEILPPDEARRERLVPGGGRGGDHYRGGPVVFR